MSKWSYVVVLAIPLTLSLGCRKRSIEDKEASPEAQLKALAQAQAEQAKTLEGYRAEIIAWRNTAMAKAMEPDFKDDLVVAKRLTQELSRHGAKQQQEEAALTVDRLARSLACLLASTPASRIQQYLERAEVQLVNGSLEEAGRAILAAAGTAYNPSAPALVPDVLSQLEEANAAVRAGDAAKAQQLVSAVMEKTRSDATAADLATACAIANEAAVSVQRKAWSILTAQAAQITSILQAVEKRSMPEARAEARTQETTVEEPESVLPTSEATAGPPGEAAPTTPAEKQPSTTTKSEPATPQPPAPR